MSLIEIVPPKVELCPSQSAASRRLVFTTSDETAIVPKPAVRFRTGDGQQTLDHTCSHYGNASTNHSFALGTHRVVCTARDHRYGNHAVAHCEFDIHVIGTKKCSILFFFIFSFFQTCRFFRHGYGMGPFVVGLVCSGLGRKVLVLLGLVWVKWKLECLIFLTPWYTLSFVDECNTIAERSATDG